MIIIDTNVAEDSPFINDIVFANTLLPDEPILPGLVRNEVESKLYQQIGRASLKSFNSM